MEDHQLIEQIKAGDQDAFDMLYEKYMNLAVRTAYLIAGNLTDSEDIVRESFVKAYLHIHSLSKNASFKPWFLKIVTRTAWAFCQKKMTEFADANIEEKVDHPDEKDSLDHILQTEQSNILYHAIRELDIKHRSVVVLYYYDQLTTKEISIICNCLEGTVKSRLFIARKKLKEALQEWKKEEETSYEKIRSEHYHSTI
ncbi:MAG: RNA polymerase sigma factor [Lachnospiraceae bacterium]|nr:RNA polymerase sigma factor [Lachnospiraceae bacterium]